MTATQVMEAPSPAMWRVGPTVSQQHPQEGDKLPPTLPRTNPGLQGALWQRSFLLNVFMV